MRIVAVIPAGRRVCMEILMLHLCRNRDLIDEVQIWCNTQPGQFADRRWIATLPKIYGKWVRLVEDGPPREENCRGIARFWTNCLDEDTLYFRFDDDIVYIHPGYFETMVKYRTAKTRPFLVFPQIWHNGIVNYLNQNVYHTLGYDRGRMDSYRYDHPLSCGSQGFATYVHESLIAKIKDKAVETLFWDKPWSLGLGEMFSISSFCFWGADFAEFGGLVDPDEEHDLAQNIPVRLGRPNAICGDALVSHFAFWQQWPGLLRTDLLRQYYEIAEELLAS